MTRDHVLAIVKQVLADVLGCPEAGLSEDTNLKDDLELNTEDGLDFIAAIEDRGLYVPRDANPFVDDDRQRIRDVGEVVDVLVVFGGQAEESADG